MGIVLVCFLLIQCLFLYVCFVYVKPAGSLLLEDQFAFVYPSVRTKTNHSDTLLYKQLIRQIKVTLWSFMSRQLRGYFLLDYSVTYLLSYFVLCCTCLMFD